MEPLGGARGRVAAAKNGGIKAIGVARLHDEAMLDASGADLVVRSLDEVASVHCFSAISQSAVYE